MGMNFRKSFKFGPFRTTISKSGISTSVGVKGARITKRADGRIQGTLGIPGTGIYYTEEISTKPSSTERPVGNQSSHGEAEENGGCFVLFVKACFVLVALFFLGIAVLLSSVFWSAGSDSPRATEPPARDIPAVTTPVETIPPETFATVPLTTQAEYDYVLNTNTKKFHYSWCSSADETKEKNRHEFTGTRDEVIAQGYEPCGRCKP